MKINASKLLSLGLAPVMLTALASAQGAPGTEIKLDFSRLGTVQLSDGSPTGVLPSGLTSAQKQAVVDEINAMLMKAGLDDKITAKDSASVAPSFVATNCIEIVVSGTGGNLAGNAGLPDQPGVVFSGGFEDRGFMGEGLENGVAETALHEAGHKLGLHHNCDDPPTVMTAGPKKTKEDREGNTCLSAEDIMRMMENCEKDGEAKTGNNGTDGGVNGGASGGSSLAGSPFITDGYFTASMYLVSGDPTAKFGFLNESGQFIYVGDGSHSPAAPTYMTFPYDAGVDFAVEIDTIPYSLSTGDAAFTLGIPTPGDPELYHRITLTFQTNQGEVIVELDASDYPEDQSTRGFFDYAGNGVHAWADQGNALPGTYGDPVLTGSGMLYRGSTDNAITLTNALENSLASVVIGTGYDGSSLFGGVLVPTTDLSVFTVTTSANGDWSSSFPIAPTATLGMRTWWQVWVLDPSGPAGYAASNGLRSTVN